MVIKEPKCINCIYYNKRDNDKLSCEKFNKIPQEYLIEIKKCKNYKKKSK